MHWPVKPASAPAPLSPTGQLLAPRPTLLAPPLRWGEQCRHNAQCRDPGLQQVRLSGDALELGFVDSAAYIAALHSASIEFPPTIFPSGSVPGRERQEALGMTNRRTLLAEMNLGTR